MEAKRCYKPNCLQKVEFHCDCISPRTFMCQGYIRDHVFIKGYRHDIQSVSRINPEMEDFALLLYKELSKIRQLKTESLNIFSQLFSSLENLFEQLCQVLDMNLSTLEQMIAKIKEEKDMEIFEINQLLRSLIFSDTTETEKACLVDEKIFTNVKAINKYANEINAMIRKLNINSPEDIEKKSFESFISPIFRENLKDGYQQNKLTCELEKWENTIMSWNQDFKNYPKTIESWYFKGGLIEFLAGDAYFALSFFNFAIKLNPNYFDCYFYKGLLLASLNRKEESLECWNYLLQKNKKLSFINIIKARTLYYLNRNEESIETYNEFIQNNPELYFVNDLKCDSLNNEKRYSEAIACCNEMIKLNTKFSIIYCNKGLAYFGLNEHTKAWEFCSKAIEIDDSCVFA